MHSKAVSVNDMPIKTGILYRCFNLAIRSDSPQSRTISAWFLRLFQARNVLLLVNELSLKVFLILIIPQVSCRLKSVLFYIFLNVQQIP